MDGDPHRGLKECPHPERFKFAFVRHPVVAYQSYWRYKMGEGWNPPNQMDKKCGSDDFETFVLNALKYFPVFARTSMNSTSALRKIPLNLLVNRRTLLKISLQRSSWLGRPSTNPRFVRFPPRM